MKEQHWFDLVIYFIYLFIYLFCWMQHNCKCSRYKVYKWHTRIYWTPSNKNKNEIAIVWPFVCSSFADLCISFDGKKIKKSTPEMLMFKLSLWICKLIFDIQDTFTNIYLELFFTLFIHWLHKSQNKSESSETVSHLRSKIRDATSVPAAKSLKNYFVTLNYGVIINKQWLCTHWSVR